MGKLAAALGVKIDAQTRVLSQQTQLKSGAYLFIFFGVCSSTPCNFVSVFTLNHFYLCFLSLSFWSIREFNTFFGPVF